MAAQSSLTMDDVSSATLLIVDDNHGNVRLLEHILKAEGYRSILGTTDPRDTLKLVAEHDPDIILLDMHMPQMDGLEVLAVLKRALPQDVYLPILAFTGSEDERVKDRALREGAMDFVTKSEDATEVLQRTKNLLRTRFLYKQQRLHARELERAVRERTFELARVNLSLQQANQALAETNEDILVRLARATEYSDDGSEGHTLRVGRLAYLTARKLGLTSEFCDTILLAARLHDVGKVAIPDGILLRPGRLSDEEQLYLREHCIIGAELLSGGQSAFLKMAEAIALTHHERWDGGGYPSGLKGAMIPIEGRITAIVDVFDTLTHARPYRPAWSYEEAKELLIEESGRHFDAQVVEAFLAVVDSLPQELQQDSHPQGEEIHSIERIKQTHF